MSTLVLFGAGASFGSEPNASKKTPPLGENLFKALCGFRGVASQVPLDIKEMFEQGFEIGMSAFHEKMPIMLQQFHREMSLYLSGFIPSQDSYYIDLLKLLHGEDVVFSSLNYDMMLEEAVFSVGMDVCYDLSRYPYMANIIKPHGSINFWPEIPSSVFQNCFFPGRGVALSTRVKPVDREAAIFRCKTDTSLSPAISMYAKGKAVSVCPEYIAEQQIMFSEVCTLSSRIIIIGVKVVPEDAHIWEPILNSGSEILYFGNSADEVELNKWIKDNGRENVVFVQGFFGVAVQYIADLMKNKVAKA